MTMAEFRKTCDGCEIEFSFGKDDIHEIEIEERRGDSRLKSSRLEREGFLGLGAEFKYNTYQRWDNVYQQKVKSVICPVCNTENHIIVIEEKLLRKERVREEESMDIRY